MKLRIQTHGSSIRKTLMFYIACFGGLEPLFFMVFTINRVPKPAHGKWPLVPKEIKRYYFSAEFVLSVEEPYSRLFEKTMKKP